MVRLLLPRWRAAARIVLSLLRGVTPQSPNQKTESLYSRLFWIIAVWFRAPIQTGSSVGVDAPFSLQSLLRFGSSVHTAASILAGAPVRAPPPIVVIHRHKSLLLAAPRRGGTAGYISAGLRPRVLSAWTSSYL